jgi:hypothetical protein
MNGLLTSVLAHWRLIAEVAALFGLACLTAWWVRREDPIDDEIAPPLSEPTRRWYCGDGSYYEGGHIDMVRDVNWDG